MSGRAALWHCSTGRGPSAARPATAARSGYLPQLLLARRGARCIDPPCHLLPPQLIPPRRHPHPLETGKTQVTVEYKKDGGAMVPQRVHTILISTQHNPDVTNEHIHKELMEHVIKPVGPEKYLDDKTIFHLNPSGR